MQYINIEAKNINLDAIQGIIKFKACYYGNVDRTNDILEKGACDETIKAFQEAKYKNAFNGNNKIPFLLEHNPNDILALNLTDFYDTNEAPMGEVKISDDYKALNPKEKIESLYNDIKNGQMFVSIGYMTRKSYIDSTGIRHLQEVEIKEVSLVTHPANPKATIVDFKNINLPKYPVNIDSSWDGALAETRWREYSKSTEKPSDNYKNAFLYFDANKPELFGSYHLQVVDIVDGEPIINQNAVFAAYQAMQGARGGLKVVPENEMPKLKGAITELYKKINRVRITEGKEQLDTPEFKTKSAIDIMTDSIRKQDNPRSASVILEKFLVDQKKAGNVKFSHTQIKNIAHATYAPAVRKTSDNMKKTLDNQNNDVKKQPESHCTETHTSQNLIKEVENKNFADIIKDVAKNFKK